MKSLISVTILLCGYIGFISAAQKPPSVCQTAECKASAQNLLNSIDLTKNPCDNFYDFACDKFIKDTPLPPYAIDYSIPDKLNDNALQLIEGIIASKNPSSTLKKAQNLYNTCLKDTNDVSILKAELQQFGGWPLASLKPNTLSLEILLANLAIIGIDSIFGADVDVNLENSNEYILEVTYGVLPVDKSLVRTEEGMDAYINFVKTSAIALGAPDSQATLTNINGMKKFCQQIAWAIPEEEVVVNLTEIYQVMTIGQLQQRTDPTGKVFNWLTYYNQLTSLKLTTSEKVGVYYLDYLVNVVQLLKTANKNDVANYIIWCLVHGYAWHTGGAILQGYVNVTEALTGTTAFEPRNTTCTGFTNEIFAFALAKQYVAEAFPASNIPHVEQIVHMTHATFNAGLNLTNIYDPQSREIAVKKNAAVNFLIGSPDWIENDQTVQDFYSTFSPMTNAHLTNAISGISSLVKKDLALLHTQVNKSRFDEYVTTADGQYDYTSNTIILPAAILQQPYFTPTQLLALDLGALGVLNGILMNAGVNNIGSQYDQNGNLHNTWTPFVQQAVGRDFACIIEQYNGYCSPTNPKLCINGTENVLNHIAEVVAIFGAYNTYQAWLSTALTQEQRLPGLEQFSPIQLLFINYAQRHCASNVPASIVNKLGYDPQLEHRYTVIGALANLPGFSQTFNCKPGLMNRGNSSCTPF